MSFSRVPTSSTTGPPKRPAPFKPPGPAKKTKPDPPTAARAKQTSSSFKRAKSGPLILRGKGPSQLVPSSSDDDEDFGTMIDIDDAALGAQLDAPLIARPDTTSDVTGKQTNIPFPLSDDEDGLVPGAEKHSHRKDEKQSEENAIPPIPRNLFTRIVHENLVDKSVKIGKDANELLGCYIDVFIREAVARAKEEKVATDGTDARADQEVWLDVVDLEKAVPGLLLDF